MTKRPNISPSPVIWFWLKTISSQVIWQVLLSLSKGDFQGTIRCSFALSECNLSPRVNVMSAGRLSKSPNENLGLTLIGATALRNTRATFGYRVIQRLLGNGTCTLLFFYLPVCIYFWLFGLFAFWPAISRIIGWWCQSVFLSNPVQIVLKFALDIHSPKRIILVNLGTPLAFHLVPPKSAVNIHGPSSWWYLWWPPDLSRSVILRTKCQLVLKKKMKWGDYHDILGFSCIISNNNPV